MMHNHEDHIIAQILSTVAPGDLVLTRYEQPQGPTLPKMVFAPALSPEGRGRIDFYAVFPGVHAALGWFKSDMLRYALAEPEEAVEIFYCHRGMMRWRMDDGAEIVLGAGEMMVQTMRNGAAATVLFPTGCAELFALSMAPKQIAQEMPDFLRKIGFSAEDFYDEVAARPRLVMAAHSLRTSFLRQFLAHRQHSSRFIWNGRCRKFFGRQRALCRRRFRCRHIIHIMLTS